MWTENHQKASPRTLLFCMVQDFLGECISLSSKRTLFFIEVAILTALALILDIVPFLKFKIWPAGGSISFAMIPVFILAFRWGLKGGLLSGFLWGILQMATGQAYVLNFWQALIEYGLAYTVLGFAGIFAIPLQQAAKNKEKAKVLRYIVIGVLIGGAARFLMHFLAGVIFFADATPEGQPAWIYSIVYNSTYMIPALLICMIVTYFLFSRQQSVLLRGS